MTHLALPDDALSQIRTYLLNLQTTICQNLEQIDTQERFITENWTSELGDGYTRVLSEGKIFEKAGVNFSQVQGERMPAAASQLRPELSGRNFQALGVSLVLHPNNPYIPTAHANFRFFMARSPNSTPIWWFGGGYDLTPYYGFDEDCRHWHQVAYQACLPYGESVYPKFKQWADDYFYLKHRKETRGIGGLFFDDLNEWGFEKCFAFLQSVGNSFLNAYLPIVEKRRQHGYSEQQKNFQMYRRGRYAEFNLVYDRGTLFGLQSGGRTESILMSLPPMVSWKYNWHPAAGSEEDKLYTDYLSPRDWLD